MKVILYMATTVNGFIAKENDDTTFVSDVEWESLQKMVRRTGDIIIGTRTYEIMSKGNELAKLDGLKAVVVVSDGSFKTSSPNHFVVNSPKEALALLEREGFREALVAGGGKLNASFMEENPIDEIYLDIEPVALGKGIKLFAEKDFERKLELIGTKKLSPHELQLHYRVLK